MHSARTNGAPAFSALMRGKWTGADASRACDLQHESKKLEDTRVWGWGSAEEKTIIV
jgi:hypothetical protein